MFGLDAQILVAHGAVSVIRGEDSARRGLRSDDRGHERLAPIITSAVCRAFHRTGAESILSRHHQTARQNREGCMRPECAIYQPGFCVRLRRCLGWKRLLTTPSRMIVTAASSRRDCRRRRSLWRVDRRA